MWNNIIPRPRLKHDVWIWRYIRLIVALLNALQQHDGSFALHLLCLCLRGCHSRRKKLKPKASYFYCVYMEITSLSCVYQFIITTGRLETQKNSLRLEKAMPRRARRRQQKNQQKYVIDLTIKPLNSNDNDKRRRWRYTDRSENCLSTRFIIERRQCGGWVLYGDSRHENNSLQAELDRLISGGRARGNERTTNMCSDLWRMLAIS